jgi:hypothetical protein
MPPYDEMTCGGAQALLEPYVDGELDQPEAKRLRAHLARCPACAAELRLAAAIRRSLRDLPELEAPPEILARTLDSIRGASRFQAPTRPEPHNLRPRPPRRAALALAAGIAALLATAVLLLHPPGKEPAGTEKAATGNLAQHPATASRPDEPGRSRPSAAEVARAARQARYAFAYVGRASRRAGLALRDEVIERRVILPATWSAARPLDPTPGFDPDSTSPPRKGT